jgi:gluconolactonase
MKDGSLTDKQLFADEGSDGLTIDSKGNVYLTNTAVKVYNPAGRLIETIEVPERPTNVCFGGKDGKTLYITARTSVYKIEMKVEKVFSN